MKMLRMKFGKTLKDGRSNRAICDTTGVEKIKAEIMMVWARGKDGGRKNSSERKGKKCCS